MYMSPVVFAHSSEPLTLSRANWLIGLVVSQTVLIAAVFLPKGWMSIRRRQRLLIVIPIFMSVGTLLLVQVHAQTSSDQVLFLLGSLIAGVGSGAMPLMWGELYGSVDVRQAGRGVGLSFIFGAVIYVIVSLLPLSTAGLLVAILPPISALLVLQLHCGGRSPAVLYSEEERRQPPLPNYLALIPAGYGALFGLILGLTDYLDPGTFLTPSALGILGTIPAALLGLLAIGLFRNEIALVRIIYRPLLPVMAAGITLLSFFGTTLVGASLIVAAFSVFDLLVWIVLSDLAHRLNYPSLRVFAVGRSATRGGVFAGFVMGQLAVSSFDVSRPGRTIISLVVLYALMLILGATRKGGHLVVLDSTLQAAPDQIPTQPMEDRFETPALRHGLSPRELDVVRLLMDGRSIDRVAQALHISQGTAKFHVRNIYKKLNVHSRQELLSFMLPAEDGMKGTQLKQPLWARLRLAITDHLRSR